MWTATENQPCFERGCARKVQISSNQYSFQWGPLLSKQEGNQTKYVHSPVHSSKHTLDVSSEHVHSKMYLGAHFWTGLSSPTMSTRDAHLQRQAPRYFHKEFEHPPFSKIASWHLTGGVLEDNFPFKGTPCQVWWEGRWLFLLMFWSKPEEPRERRTGRRVPADGAGPLRGEGRFCRFGCLIEVVF